MKKFLGIIAALALAGASFTLPVAAQQITSENLESNFVPAEPNFSNGTLWGLNSAFGINEKAALELTSGSSAVVVAVIDTGITPHSDLSANVIAGYDFVSNSSNANDGQAIDSKLSDRDADPSDPGDGDETTARKSVWHGTHVSGIIGALANGTGILGVSPTVSVMPVRALGRDGGLLTDIQDAITWASGGSVDGVKAAPLKRADVINLSLGITVKPSRWNPKPVCPSDLQSVIDAAVKRGTVIVAAAGNNGSDVQYTFPANCKNVITVAATTVKGERAYFSNYGTATNSSDVISIAAPGYAIFSTYNDGEYAPGNEMYAYLSGTSMATPYVAGVVALMRAINPGIPVAEIMKLIKDPANATALSSCLNSAGQNVLCGAGIINAGKILSTFSGLTTYSSQDSGIPETPPVSPIIESPPVIDPVIAPAPLTFAAKKKFSGKNFAAQSGVDVPAKSTVTLSVKSGKKFCKIKSGKLATLKTGSCTVAVKVKTKVKTQVRVKVGKKYKVVYRYKTETKTTKVPIVIA